MTALASPAVANKAQPMPVLLGAPKQYPNATKEDSKLGSASAQKAASKCEAEDHAPPVRPVAESHVGRDEDVDIDPESAFNVQAELGRGSFGAVYSAVHRETGRLYALKVLNKAVYGAKQMFPYAQTERNVHACMRHPFIVGLHLAFQTPSLLVMVLPYCPGGSLFELIHAQKERRLPESVARVYFAETCLAVEHLHKHGVVHRDIKTANVLLDEEGHAMLTDFGLSKEGVEGPAGARSFAGTLMYLAPEILEKRGHGAPVDVYCLGSLLFEMLTGEIPFRNSDMAAFARSVCHEELEMPTVVAGSAERLIRDCMAKDPAARPFAAELRTYAFFCGVDFELVLRREVHAPWVGPRPKPRSSVLSRLLLKLPFKSPFLTDDELDLPQSLGVCQGQLLDGWDFKGADWGRPPQRDSGSRRPRAAGGTENGSRASCLLRFWQGSARGGAGDA